MILLLLFIFVPVASQTNGSKLSCFRRIKNGYLANSAHLYVPFLGTVDKCLHQCLTSEKRYNFRCQSVMWYVDAGDCMLSASNRHQFPHLFTISDNYRIDFYENIACTRNRTTSALELMTTRPPPQQQTKKPIMIAKIPLPSLIHPITQKQIIRKQPIAIHRELSEEDNDDQPMEHIRTTIEPSTKPIAIHRELSEEVNDDQPMEHIRTTIEPSKKPIKHIRTRTESSTTPPTNTFMRSDMRNDASIGMDMNAIEERKCFKFEHGRELLGFEEERWMEVTINECLHVCLRRSANKFHCGSISYFRQQKLCIINTGDQWFADNSKSLVTSIADHYENQCAPGWTIDDVEPVNTDVGFGGNFRKDHKLLAADLISMSQHDSPTESVKTTDIVASETTGRKVLTKEQLRCYLRFPNTIVLELDTIVMKRVKSVMECLWQCEHWKWQNSRHSCKAVLWYRMHSSCTIFRNGRDNETLESSSVSDYYLNTCLDEPTKDAEIIVKTKQDSLSYYEVDADVNTEEKEYE